MKSHLLKGLMLGSSIFEQWQAAQGRYHSYELINRAIGGTTANFWTTQIAATLKEDSFKFVMLYCGSNDFNQGLGKDAIVTSLKSCIEQVRDKLGNQALCYCSIMKAPQKLALGLGADIDFVNQAISSFLGPRELMIDMDEALGENREHLRSPLFLEDQLHLTDEAYSRIGDFTFPKLEAWIRLIDR